MKLQLSLLSLIILSAFTDAFLTFPPSSRLSFLSPLHSSAEDPIPHSSAQDILDATEHAAWQDIWEYDSAMSNTYAGYFKVGNWLKSMPCGKGLNQDCPNEVR